MEQIPLNIRLLHLSTARTWRGGEQQIAYLAEELSRVKGLTQIIVCARYSAMHLYCREKGLPHRAFTKAFSFNLFFAYQLKRVCRQHQIDLIHLHDPHAHQFGVLASDVFGNSTPMLLSRRVDYPVKSSSYSQYKYNHPQIKRIICVSEAVRQVMSKTITDPTKLVRVYSGIDLGKFSNIATTGLLRKTFHIASDEKIIGNTGALTEQKDYPTFLDTARRLLDEGVKAKFVIIGQGHLLKQLTRYASKLDLLPHVIFTGFRSDVASLLTEFDLFMSTSAAEGLGTSIADAMACGIPVIATDAGGVGEMVLHEQTGLLVPVGDSLSLSKAVQRLLQNPALAKQLSQHALLHIQQFSKANTAQNTLGIYRTVLKEANQA